MTSLFLMFFEGETLCGTMDLGSPLPAKNGGLELLRRSEDFNVSNLDKHLNLIFPHDEMKRTKEER